MPKQPLTFPCSRCGRRMGVGLELAGRRVRCPLCREVVTAPAASAGPAPQPTPNRGPEGVESIFADPAESEDSVIGGAPAHKKPVLPSDPGLVPVTTPRPAPRTAVPFIAKPPSSQRHPAAPPAAGAPPPPAEEGNPFAGLDREPLPLAEQEGTKGNPQPAEPPRAEAVQAPPTDEDNPFADLASAPPPPRPRSDKAKRRSPTDTGDSFSDPDRDPPRARPVSGKARRSPREVGAAVPVWVWVVVAALAGYGMVMTAVAAWGWLR
jgi:hypothetical protein